MCKGPYITHISAKNVEICVKMVVSHILYEIPSLRSE